MGLKRPENRFEKGCKYGYNVQYKTPASQKETVDIQGGYARLSSTKHNGRFRVLNQEIEHGDNTS
jgi:hypothetical protein